MPEDPTRDSVAAYVLGALEPEQMEAVRLHLRVCADCRALERRMRRTATMLAFSAQEATAPPDLGQRILAAAGAEPRPRSARPAPIRTAAPPAPRPERWRAVAALLGGAVLALAGWNVYLGVQVRELQLARPRAYSMRAAPALAGARGQVISLPGQRTALVEFTGLPPVPADRVYELWLETASGRLEPAGVFTPEAGSRIVVLDRDLSDYRLIALTVEPGPHGTGAPTEAPRMTGSLG